MSIRALRAAIPDPFPQRAMKKLHFCQNLALTAPNTNLTVEKILSLSSAYDPEQLGAGDVQPNYWDTLAVLYSLYMVHSVECEITFYDPNQDGLLVGFQLQGTSASGLTIADVSSRPLTRYATIANTGQQTYTFHLRAPIHEVLGLRRGQYANDTNNYGAATSASPASQAYIRLFALSTQAGVATTLKCMLKFNYVIQFWNRPSSALSVV
jgi:hypothetical protein